MKQPRVRIIKEDKRCLYVIVSFIDDNYDWHSIKLKIPKRKLEKI